MIELLPPIHKYPFMNLRLPFALFSIALTGIALFFIVKKGFNYGVDFSGGVQTVLEFSEKDQVTAEKLRSAFDQMGLHNASVQAYGTTLENKANQYITHFSSDFVSEGTVSGLLETSMKALRPADLKPEEKLIQKFKFVGLEKAYMTLNRPLDLGAIQNSLKSVNFGLLKLTEVSPFGRGTQNEFQIQFSSISEVVTSQLSKALNLAREDVKILKVDFVGAKVGADLRMAALLSLIFTMALIFVYIFVRFDLVYAPGVVLALAHDVIISAGFFAYSGMEFDLTIIAALLTLAGYSINDTIVVYDRIREVSGTMKGKTFREIIDIAINQTLGRTIITSITVFLATLALWIWGGPVLHGFSYCFLIGIVVGTYSSVFVAAPTILLMKNWLGQEATRTKKAAA